MAKTGPSHTKQLIGSLIVAVFITVVVVVLVTAKIGPGFNATCPARTRTDRSGAEKSTRGTARGEQRQLWLGVASAESIVEPACHPVVCLHWVAEAWTGRSLGNEPFKPTSRR